MYLWLNQANKNKHNTLKTRYIIIFQNFILQRNKKQPIFETLFGEPNKSQSPLTVIDL